MSIENYMDQNGGSITTADLIPKIEGLMKPVGLDAQILNNRKDNRLSQKIRNLKSHNTLEKMGVATYDYTNGKYTITNNGRKYLASRMGRMTALLSRP